MIILVCEVLSLVVTVWGHHEAVDLKLPLLIQCQVHACLVAVVFFLTKLELPSSHIHILHEFYEYKIRKFTFFKFESIGLIFFKHRVNIEHRFILHYNDVRVQIHHFILFYKQSNKKGLPKVCILSVSSKLSIEGLI